MCTGSSWSEYVTAETASSSVVLLLMSSAPIISTHPPLKENGGDSDWGHPGIRSGDTIANPPCRPMEPSVKTTYVPGVRRSGGSGGGGPSGPMLGRTASSREALSYTLRGTSM